MAEIIELESVRAKAEVARNERHGQALADGLKLLNISVNEINENSLLLMVTLVGLINGYGNRSTLCEDLPEDLQFEIGESLRFLRDVHLPALKKEIPALEALLERFTTGTKVPIPSII